MACTSALAHVLLRNRHQRFIPEDRPFVNDYDLSPDVSFSFIDVIPGAVRPHEFHQFPKLVDEANRWCTANREWEIVNCETVLLFFKWIENELHLAPEDTCFPLDGDFHQSLLGLRLWVLRRPEGQMPTVVPRLKYVDFAPRKDKEDPSSRFRKLDAVLERINSEIQARECDPRMGDIITIETLYHPVASSDWIIDDKNTLNLFPSRCVSIIRIFYFSSTEIVDEFPIIGLKDFIPKQLSGGGFFKMPVFETFSAVMKRASDWISCHPEVEFKNAQCLEVKMRIMGRIDTKTMSHSGDFGNFVRIFRVAYTTSPVATLPPNPLPVPIFLSSVIFAPADRDASVSQIKSKIHEWVEDGMPTEMGSRDLTSIPRLLSAETVEIFCKDFSEDEITFETENTFKPNRIGTKNQFLFMAFRVYFDAGFTGRRAGRRVSQTLAIPSKFSRSKPSCQLI